MMSSDNHNNISTVSDNHLCSNCGACIAVCPVNAISMGKTRIGRMFAEVNSSCIECGRCLKVCPSRSVEQITGEVSEESLLGEIQSILIGRSTRTDIFERAQSGGVVTSVLTYLFESGKIDGALLVRMTPSFSPSGEAVIVTSSSELNDTQKSCYTPVALLGALKSASSFFSLAVVGLPCHIRGAVSLAHNLKCLNNIHYKIGLICDRTMCEGIQDILTPSRMRGLKRRIIFRTSGHVGGKFIPYKESVVSITPEGGEPVLVPRESRFALKDMFTSPRCRICPDKLNVLADITLGDPWGMDGADEKFGNNVIIVRTSVGQQCLEGAVNEGLVLIEKESNREELIRGQHIRERIQQVERYADAYRGVEGKEKRVIRSFYATESSPSWLIHITARKRLFLSRIKNQIKYCIRYGLRPFRH